MTTSPNEPGPLVYIAVGEDSGDGLGAALVEALRGQAPGVRFAGLAGPRMRALGLTSLFNIADLSVMGVSAVLARLPMLLARIATTADDILRARPDVVVLIDSPEFNLRVARRVRRANPSIPIVKYVCPSVWAWRPWRAAKLKPLYDHVLALLPFEPALMQELGGSPATYVGHPLASRIAPPPGRTVPSAQKTLLLLPGSRRSEVRLLLPAIERTVDILGERGNRFRLVLPAAPGVAGDVRAATARWRHQPEIVEGDHARQAAFAAADAALAASGTVLLELAVARVPTISIYRLDGLMHWFRHLITGWTAALPNLIADRAFLPERIGDMVRPGWLARAIEELMKEGAARQAQLDGFEAMANAMKTDEPPAEIAARIVLRFARSGRAA
jgi:lipid-A-disaccharide synthase